MHTSQANPFVIPADITARVEATMAAARSRFGHDAFRMEDKGGAGEGGESSGEQTSANAGGDSDKAAGQPGEQDKPGTAAEKVEDLPDWAQTLIKNTRSEAAGNRTKATEAEQKQAQLLDGIAKALGVKKGDDAPTPEQLATQLGETTQSFTTLQREHQVLLAALDASADHKALLDSRSFLTKVDGLDPAAKDFATKVKAEVDSALKDNPKLKVGQAPGSSGADHSGGSGEGTDPAARAKPGQSRIAAAYANS